MECPNSYLRIFISVPKKEKYDGGRNFQTPAWEYSHQFNAKKCCSIVISVMQCWSFANMYISDFTIMILQKYTRQYTEALKSLLGCPLSLSLRCAMSINVMIWSLWFIKNIHERHKKGVFLSLANGKVSCKNRFNVSLNLFQLIFFVTFTDSSRANFVFDNIDKCKRPPPWTTALNNKLLTRFFATVCLFV